MAIYTSSWNLSVVQCVPLINKCVYISRYIDIYPVINQVIELKSRSLLQERPEYSREKDKQT